MGVLNGTSLKLPLSSVATKLDGMPVPVNVMVAPGIALPSPHTNIPDNSERGCPTFTSKKEKNVASWVFGQVGDGEGVVLVGSILITFEELKSHDVPAVQFWFVIMLLPLFENTFELADVLPIASVLNNTAARVTNTNVVDVSLIQ